MNVYIWHINLVICCFSIISKQVVNTITQTINKLVTKEQLFYKISEKQLLKTDGGCSSAFGNSTSFLHRNVHTSSLDSSYCVITHFLTISSPEPSIQSTASICSTRMNTCMCAAHLILAWTEFGFYEALWPLNCIVEQVFQRPAAFPEHFYLSLHCVDTTAAQKNVLVSSVDFSLFGREVNWWYIGF